MSDFLQLKIKAASIIGKRKADEKRDAERQRSAQKDVDAAVECISNLNCELGVEPNMMTLDDSADHSTFESELDNDTLNNLLPATVQVKLQSSNDEKSSTVLTATDAVLTTNPIDNGVIPEVHDTSESNEESVKLNLVQAVLAISSNQKNNTKTNTKRKNLTNSLFVLKKTKQSRTKNNHRETEFAKLKSQIKPTIDEFKNDNETNSRLGVFEVNNVLHKNGSQISCQIFRNDIDCLVPSQKQSKTGSVNYEEAYFNDNMIHVVIMWIIGLLRSDDKFTAKQFLGEHDLTKAFCPEEVRIFDLQEWVVIRGDATQNSKSMQARTNEFKHVIERNVFNILQRKAKPKIFETNCLVFCQHAALHFTMITVLGLKDALSNIIKGLPTTPIYATMLDSLEKTTTNYRDLKQSQLIMVRELIMVSAEKIERIDVETVNILRSLFKVVNVSCPRQTDGRSCGMFIENSNHSHHVL